MGRIQFDASLIADAYDMNRNGFVSDELKVEHPSVDADGDAAVSVAELAASLEKDAVEVSGGAIRAAQVRAYPEIGDVLRLTTIAEAVKAGKRVGNRHEPFERDIERLPDGSTREVIDYEEANTRLKRELKSIAHAASTGEDPVFSDLKRIADGALDSWWHADDRRYQVMYRALEEIATEMGDVPLQPEAAVQDTNRALQEAQSRLSAAKKELGTPQAQQKLLADAEALLEAEKSKKGLMKMFAARKITKLESSIEQLKTFHPDALTRQLSETARKTYELSLTASDANTLAQARLLDAASRDLRYQASAITKEAIWTQHWLTFLKQTL